MKINLATSGLWKIRSAIESVTGGVVTKSWPLFGRCDVIVGWGHKPTAKHARWQARNGNIAYIAFEDGFLRSIAPGDGELPASVVVDRTGVYYDHTQPCDLEALILKRSTLGGSGKRARMAMTKLRQSRLSKYNNSSMQDVSDLKLGVSGSVSRVLVIDQTAGDASIVGAGACDDTFEEMLETAVIENPQSKILLRVHPETMTGRKAGHFGSEQLNSLAATRMSIAQALQNNRLRLSAEPINPWALLEACSKIYCVSSQLGFEGLMAGKEVHCFGMPFYAGWGLTRDRNIPPPRRRKPASLEAIVAAVYFDYCRYLDQDCNAVLDFDAAVERLVAKRAAFLQSIG